MKKLANLSPTINLPGSKSISQRALILASEVITGVFLENFSICEDTDSLIKALRLVGVIIKKTKNGIFVKGVTWNDCHRTIDFRENGTGSKFFIAAAVAMGINVKVSASTQLANRPILPLINALRSAGAIIYGEKFPFKILKSELKNTHLEVPANVSSQIISALIIAECLGKIRFKIHLRNKIVSKPYIKLTEKIILDFKRLIKSESTGTLNYYIESDFSSACPFLLYEQLSGKKLRFNNLPSLSLQPDYKLQKYFKKLPNKLNIINTPDGAISLILLAAFVNKKTTFTNIEHLRLKESNRIALIRKNLQKLGIKSTETKHSLTIFQCNSIHNRKITIETGGDHRIAMNFAMLSEKFPGITIDNKKCVKKSFPNFWKELQKLKIDIQSSQKKFNGDIIFIGSRGTGKTTLGKGLAKELSLTFIDLDEEMEKEEKIMSKLAKGEISWAEFRKLESKYLKKTIRQPFQKIISTGGGCAESQLNRRLMKKNAFIVYLHGNPAEIGEKLQARKNKPAYINSHLEDMMKRDKLYSPIANFILNTSPWNKRFLIQKIIKNLNHKIPRNNTNKQ